MQDSIHSPIVISPIVMKNAPPGEPLHWSGMADANAVREAARASMRWLRVFFWLAALAAAALSLTSAYSVLRLGIRSSLPVLLAALIFVIAALIIRRQAWRNRELETCTGDIFYALTEKLFLVVLSDTGRVRRYGPSAFRKIRVVRPGILGGKNAIWFGWQAKDIGGKYTDVLYPGGDPSELVELLRLHFGAKVLS